ncbi:MAG: extracellular solute-binding protein, partial [Bacilli bacterium]
MKKTLSSLLSIFLAVMLIVGCAGNGSDSKVKEGTEGDTEVVSEGDTEGKISGDFEIQYFVGGYGDAWWKEVIGEFQKKYPDLNIKQSAGPKINDQMKPRWIQGDPPDVVYIDGNGSSAPQMVKDKQLMDITEWLKTAKNADGELIVDQFISPAADYDGKTYTLPLVFGTWGTWYDQALFETNGWDVPKDFEGF